MRASLTRPMPLLAGLGALLVAVYLGFVVTSPAVRHHWPLPLVAALLAAGPFLLREPATRPAPEPTAVPVLRATAVSVPRERSEESDDAHAVDVAAGRVAVADGVSSSFRAAAWSRLLCAGFLTARPSGGTAWITDAAAAFRDEAGGEWSSADAPGREARAEFAGLSVTRQGERLRWRATAVGDCVVVHLRPTPAGPAVTAFPITYSAAPADPSLLSSAVDEPPPIAHLEGAARIGDTWLLMTATLARWALRRHEAGNPAWELLAGSEVVVVTTIATARATGEVPDDDMTVARCTVVAGG